MATKNGNRIVIDSRPELGTIQADQIRVRQALLNLASNASKFIEKGTVTITRQRLDVHHPPAAHRRDRAEPSD
jgi:signal transduction histidine kinase